MNSCIELAIKLLEDPNTSSDIRLLAAESLRKEVAALEAEADKPAEIKWYPQRVNDFWNTPTGPWTSPVYPGTLCSNATDNTRPITVNSIAAGQDNSWTFGTGQDIKVFNPNQKAV